MKEVDMESVNFEDVNMEVWKNRILSKRKSGKNICY